LDVGGLAGAGEGLAALEVGGSLADGGELQGNGFLRLMELQVGVGLLLEELGVELGGFGCGALAVRTFAGGPGKRFEGGLGLQLGQPDAGDEQMALVVLGREASGSLERVDSLREALLGQVEEAEVVPGGVGLADGERGAKVVFGECVLVLAEGDLGADGVEEMALALAKSWYCCAREGCGCGSEVSPAAIGRRFWVWQLIAGG
jgi:hypothetical protein